MDLLRLSNLERAKNYLSLAKFYLTQTGVDKDVVDDINKIIEELEFRIEYIQVKEDDIDESEDY